MSLIFCALVVILVSMVWVVRDRGAGTDVALAPAPRLLVETVAVPTAAAVPAAVPAAVTVQATGVLPVAPTAMTVTPPTPAAEEPAAKSSPLVHVAPDGTVNYTARAGDTVSDLAVALRGSDSKANRDAVIAANASLQANPDRVLEGQSYSLAPAQAVTASAAPAAADAPEEAAVAPQNSASARNLKYIAQPGDNVAVLAASLLGGDTKTNRQAVISGNASLQADPDHLVAGKTYNIQTTNGLAAAPASGQSANQSVAPSTQPDADEAARLSAGRVLRYTAQPGDTVSKLATVLLGSDTKANRDLIISNNHSLQVDPDHLVAGKMYWIAAPTPTLAPVAESSAQ